MHGWHNLLTVFEYFLTHNLADKKSKQKSDHFFIYQKDKRLFSLWSDFSEIFSKELNSPKVSFHQIIKNNEPVH